jgi:hypothetical protein
LVLIFLLSLFRLLVLPGSGVSITLHLTHSNYLLTY